MVLSGILHRVNANLESLTDKEMSKELKKATKRRGKDVANG